MDYVESATLSRIISDESSYLSGENTLRGYVLSGLSVTLSGFYIPKNQSYRGYVLTTPPHVEVTMIFVQDENKMNTQLNKCTNHIIR